MKKITLKWKVAKKPERVFSEVCKSFHIQDLYLKMRRVIRAYREEGLL